MEYTYIKVLSQKIFYKYFTIHFLQVYVLFKASSQNINTISLQEVM